MQEANGNTVDQAIRAFAANSGLMGDEKLVKMGEIPFDYQRRMSSVVFEGEEEGELTLICKVGVMLLVMDERCICGPMRTFFPRPSSFAIVKCHWQLLAVLGRPPSSSRMYGSCPHVALTG